MISLVFVSARSVVVVAGLVLLACYVIGSGAWVQTSGSWYSSLARPSWQPPDWVFGVIWPYNFTILGIALFVVPGRLPANRLWLWVSFFAMSVIAALGWSYLFYVPHALAAASISLAVAALATLPLVWLVWSVSRPIALALVPYQVWLFLAASLSAGYASRN
ncbi:MAG: tryptophan-rich sensory protein [Actinobacteria bacterium]|nr:tryptophan-rich sensory protein [Actinomycetota bacterium]